MHRLGLRLTLVSGREPLVRLLVTAAAVAIGVAIMLAVLADFHAFRVSSDRPSWESTTGKTVSAGSASAPHSELWNYGNDIYRGQHHRAARRRQPRARCTGPAGNLRAAG